MALDFRVVGCVSYADLQRLERPALVRHSPGVDMGPRNRPRTFIVRLAAIALGSAIALPITAGGVAAAGLLTPYQAYPVGSWPDAVAIGDVTGDGRADVVDDDGYYFDPANDFQLWVFAQGADGTLAAPVSYATLGTYTTAPSRSRSATSPATAARTSSSASTASACRSSRSSPAGRSARRR